MSNSLISWDWSAAQLNLITNGFKTTVIEFLVCSLAHSHCVLANNNNPAFSLKWKSDAMSNAAAFKSFRREADVLSNNMAKKKKSVMNTKVENLIIKKQFQYSIGTCCI